MKEICVYTPRKAFMDFHNSKKRWSVLCCHRAAGKSVATVNQLIRKATERSKGIFSIISPTFTQGKRSIWPLFHEFAGKIPGVKFNESDLLVTFPNASRIYLLGSENSRGIRGIHQNGVILDEYQHQPPDLFGEIVMPTLTTHNGFAAFIGTTYGKNHMWKLLEKRRENPDWFSLMLPASKSGILTEAQLAAAKDNMTEAQHLQEYELEPMAFVEGAIFLNEMRFLREQNRITTVPFEEYASVDTYWDLGFGDYTVVTFVQEVGLESHVIDHYSTHGTGLADIAREVKSRGYNYGTHYLPHDARNHELQTGQRRVDFLRPLLAGDTVVVDRPRKKEDAIQSFRLQYKKLWVDSKLENFIEAMEQYQQEFDEDLRVFKGIPKHNWASHTVDSILLWSQVKHQHFMNRPTFKIQTNLPMYSGSIFQDDIRR